MELFEEFRYVDELNEFIKDNKLENYNVEIFKCRNDKLHISSCTTIQDSVVAKEILIYILRYKLEKVSD